LMSSFIRSFRTRFDALGIIKQSVKGQSRQPSRRFKKNSENVGHRPADDYPFSDQGSKR
jgi:hypothetical protein